MIGVDRLLDIATYLQRNARTHPDIISTLRQFLTSIFESNEYQRWLEGPQFAGPRSVEGMPREPREAAKRYPELKHLLTEYSLISNGRINAKIDRHFNRIHLTDGFWVEPMRRVFPTCDESELVCNFVKQNVDLSGVGYLIDPACGSGHHALGLREKFKRRVSLDISGRALAFCRFNSVLQGDTKHAVGFGDVRVGIPLEFAPPTDSHVVFTVNMPFAIDPRVRSAHHAYSLAQDGGDRGIELSLAALEAVREFANRFPELRWIDAVILAYSLGKPASGDTGWDWELYEKARSLFRKHDVKFHLLSEEKLWRVNGKKERANPMPVEELQLKADCKFTYADTIRTAKRKAFRDLSNLYRKAGYTHLGYGIVHVKIRR